MTTDEPAEPSISGNGVVPSPSRDAAGLQTLPPRGRLLGVDIGTVRIGLAVCDQDRIMASPLETYQRKNPPADALHYQKLIKTEEVVGIVVGWPILMNGDEGTQALDARKYADWLAKTTGLPVVLQDERCTTSAAEDILWNAGLTRKRRKAHRDQLAAQFILQSYMDTQRQS